VIVASAKEWYLVAARKKEPRVQETPYEESRLAVN
jgi:hypothetical protein